MRLMLLSEMASRYKNQIANNNDPQGRVRLIKGLISEGELVPVGINAKGDSCLAQLQNVSTILLLGDGSSGNRDTAKDVLRLLTEAYPDNKYIFIDSKGSGWSKIARKTSGDIHEGPRAYIKIASVLGELAKRAELFKENGVESILEFRKKYAIDLPRIFLMIDSLDSLLEELSEADKEFFHNLLKIIIRRSIPLGFHLIITASDKSQFDYLAKGPNTLIFYHKNKYPGINRLDFHRQLREIGHGEYIVNIDKKILKWFMPR